MQKNMEKEEESERKAVCHSSAAAGDSDGRQEEKHLLWLLELT